MAEISRLSYLQDGGGGGHVTSIRYFRFAVFQNLHVYLRLNTNFHRNRPIFDCSTAHSLLNAPNWLISGRKTSFRGLNPLFWGGFYHFYVQNLFLLIETHHLMLISWKSENLDFRSFSHFFAVPLTLKFCGFRGRVSPLSRQVYLNLHEVIPVIESHRLSP